jgi:hypothetical protein
MSDKIKNRTSRESEVRNKELRKKPWTPPSSLDAPPAPEGFCHRWIRVETMGFQDTANVSKKLREGWEFVRAEEIKNSLGDHDYPVIRDGQYAGLIGVGGLVLARIPEEIIKSRAEYFQKITQDRIHAIDNDLMKEQRPGMAINIDRQSRVTFGGGRKS